MPLINLDPTDPAAAAEAAAAIRALPQGTPVVVLIHGYRYAPDVAGHCPRETLYARTGWPGQLAISDALVIGFCWNARGTIWHAWSAAERAGVALAGLMAAGGRPIDVVAHSLGARVALIAAGLAPAGTAGRLILLAAAAFRGEAQAVLSTPGGRAIETFNVTSRENDIFDLLLEGCIRDRSGPALGSGLGEWRRNWLDIRIDRAEVRAALGLLGFQIPGPGRAACHWSGYLRPGLFPFYAALIRDRALLPLPLLASLLPDETPAQTDRRWRGLPQVGRRAI
jgi:pimeloyl-ACP methyl ester carboxylesterase